MGNLVFEHILGILACSNSDTAETSLLIAMKAKENEGMTHEVELTIDKQANKISTKESQGDKAQW